MDYKKTVLRVRSYILVPANYFLGRIYQRRKQYDLAAIFYSKTLRGGKSKSSELYFRYAYSLRKLNQRKAERKKERKKERKVSISRTKIISEHLEEIINRSNHDEPRHYTEYAALMVDLSEYAEAEEALLKALSLKPDDPKIMANIADVYIRRKKWWQAKDLLESVHELSYITEKTLSLLGKASYEMNDFVVSAESYEKAALKCNKDAKKAEHLYLAGLAYDLVSEKKAIENYSEAIKLDDKYEASRLGIGAFYQKLKIWERARDAYLKSLESVKNHEVKAEVYFRLGQVYKNLYDNKNAIKSMKKAVALDARWAKWHFQLGKIYADEQQYDEAIDSLYQAKNRSIDCKNAYILTLGDVLGRAGRSEDAAAILREMKLLSSLYKKSKQEQKVQDIYRNFVDGSAIDENMIVYETFHGSNITCNPYAIFRELLKQPRFNDYVHIWVVNDFSLIPKDMISMRNVYFIPRHSVAYQTYIAKAKWLINNVTFPEHFIRKPEQKYLNTWHGTPWKALGKNMANWVTGMANSQRNFLQATHMISSNKFTSDILIDGYDVKGIYQGTLAELGYPRIDRTIAMSKADKKELRELMGIQEGKKTILYAPTWRAKNGVPVNDTKQTEQTVKAMIDQGYNVIFRGHQLAAGNKKSALLNKVKVPDYISTNDLLAIADILVTDYSSVYIDFMATNRPIIFHIYDKEEYQNDRGLYYGIEELPGVVTTDEEGLLTEIKNAATISKKHPNYAKVKQKYLKHEDGKATDRTIKYFFDNDSTYVDHEVNKIPEGKAQVLIQGGKFMSNGITSTLISLVKKLDTDKVQPIITVDSKTIAENEGSMKLLSKIADDAQIITRCGGLAANYEEKRVIRSFHVNKQFLNDEHKLRFAGIYKKEYQRIFGGYKFDHVIDFVGFSIVWTPVFAFSELKSEKGLKSIYLHNNIQGEIDRRFPNQETMVRLYDEFDNVVSVSEATKDVNLENLSERYGITEKKFIFVDNIQNPEDVIERSTAAIESEKVAELLGNGRTSFITIGRLSVEKDHAKLIHAFKEVHEKYPKTQLLIAGDGPLKHYLESVIRKLQLDSCVHLLGHTPNPFPVLNESDCFVLSSLHEGQPTVLFEALTLKKPIVATDIPANIGVLKNEYGLLVSGDGPEGLVEGMTAYLEDDIDAKEFDIDKYQKESVDMFMQKILNISES